MADLNDINLRIVITSAGVDAIKSATSAVGGMGSAISGSAGAANAAKSSWSDFGRALSDLERNFDAVFRAASHLQALGRDITGLGQAGIGVLKESVEQWGSYEFAVHRAAGALGIFDTTSPIFDRLQAAINNTAQEARLFPADDIAKATYYWGSATGQTVKNEEELALVMKGLLPIMQTAAITETSYEQAIKGTYQIVQQYRLGLYKLADAQDVAAGRATAVGEKISNVGDITEKLMMITQNTAVEYSDLIEAFKYTGSIAPSLGVSFEDVALVLGRLGDLGIRGSSAGRALAQTFAKLVDPTVRASKALDSAWEANYGLGKSFEEMVFPNGEFIGLAEYVDQLADVTEDMTTKERDNLIAVMTTANELRTMIPLVEDQIRARKEGISVYDDEKYNLELASKQFEQTMHLLEISWQGTMGYLKESIGPVVRAIGQAAAALAAPFVESLGKMFISLKEWLDTHPEITRWGVKLLAIASIAAIVLGSIFTVLGVLLAFGAGIAFVVKSLGMAFIGFDKTIKVVDEFDNVVGSKIVRMQGVLRKFIPVIALITGAIVAGVYIWNTNFGGLRDALERVGAAFATLFSKLDFSGASGGGIDVLKMLGQVLLPPLEIVAKLVAAALESLAFGLELIAGSEHATAVVQGMVTVLMALFALNSAKQMLDIAGSVVTLGNKSKIASNSVGFLWAELVKLNKMRKAEGISGIFTSIGSSAKGAATTVASSMRGIATSTAVAARGVSLSIKSVLIASGIGILIVAITLLVEAWMNNWGDIQGKFAAVSKWIGDRFSDLAEWIGEIVDAIVQHWENFRSSVIEIWENVTTSIRDGVNNVITFFRELPGKIGDFMSSLWDTVTTWIGNIIDTIVSFPGKVWDGLVGAIATLFDNYNAWWESMGVATEERLGFILGYVFTWVGQMLGALVGWLASLPGLFWDWLSQVAVNIATWATETWIAFDTWVTSVWNTITTWLSQLPGHIADFFATIWTNLTTWFSETWTAFDAWVTSVFNNVVDWLGKLPGRIGEFLSQMWTKFSTWFGQLIINVGTWASNTLTAIIDWISQLPGKIVHWLGQVFIRFSNWFTKELIPNAGTYALDAITAIIDWFKKLPGRAVAAIHGLIQKLETFLKELPGKIWDAITGVGKDIIDGIRKGIEDAWNGFINWWTNLFSGMEKGAAAATESSSPSKVYMRLGGYIMDGLELGIKRNNGAVKAMEGQIESILGVTDRLATNGVGELGGSVGFSMDATKTITIHHEVSSPDGTVNSSSQETLKNIFTADEFVSALEHMVTVG